MALEALFNEIAAAIHEKDGKTDGIAAEDFPDRIRAIPSGGLNGVILESIEIVTPPLKTMYLVGEEFDPNGMVVYANFSNNQTMQVDHSSLMFEPSGPLSIDTNYISVNFQWGIKMASSSQPIQVTVAKLEWWSPHMTSSATPAPYVVKESSVISGLAGWLAFNGNKTTPQDMWHSDSSNGNRIQFDFGKDVLVYGIRMYPDTSTQDTWRTCIPKTFEIEGSNDATNWNTLFTPIDSDTYTPEIGVPKECVFLDNIIAYRYFRIVCHLNYNGSHYACIEEIEFYLDPSSL